MVVEQGNCHFGIAGAQGNHQLRRRERAATEGEEVGLRSLDARAENIPPQPRKPAHGAAEFRAVVFDVARRRPRQRIAVHLSRRASREFIQQDQAGHHRGGQ